MERNLEHEEPCVLCKEWLNKLTWAFLALKQMSQAAFLEKFEGHFVADGLDLARSAAEHRAQIKK